MSNKKLKKAFSIQLSEPKWKTALRGARENMSEAAIKKMERKVHQETQRQVELAEQRAAAALAAKQEKEAAKKAAAAAKEQQRREKQAQTERCTCRSPRVKNGVCTRCRRVPASRKRGLFG